MITACIVNYNTTQLVECLIKSINKNTPDVHIYVFDNSDIEPFTTKIGNVSIIDNTKGQIINFDAELDKYPGHVESGAKINNYGSFKHCISVDRLMDIIKEPFVLLDSDILLKKDFSDIIDNNYCCCGDIEPQWNQKNRIAPYLCYINTPKCIEKGIRYFNEYFMHGLNMSKEGDEYDTGGFFYKACGLNNIKKFNCNDYLVHYKGGSWEDVHNNRKEGTVPLSRNLKMSHQKWLAIHHNLWNDSPERIIITMTSWAQRIGNVATVLSTIQKQTLKPEIININLSLVEFPNKEQDLPQNLKDLIAQDETITINWLDGVNRRQWKKIIPSFIKYPNDALICIDDDRLYPTNFVESLYNKHKEIPNNPITVNGIKGKHYVNGMLQHCGHGTLDKLDFYGDILEVLDEEIYAKESSDTCFTFFANRAGHPIIFVNVKLNSDIKLFNEVSPLNKTNGTYSIDLQKETLKFLEKKFMDPSRIKLYCTFYKDGQFKSSKEQPSYLIPYNTNSTEFPTNNLNPYWSEFILMKNIWKQGKQSDFIGFEQYDSHFPYDKIFSVLNQNKVFVHSKMQCVSGVRAQHALCHMACDYNMALDILNARYGNGNKYVEYLCNGKELYFKSCFIMSWERFSEMCDFIFYVLDEMDRRLKLNMDPKNYEAYYHLPSTIANFASKTRDKGEAAITRQKRAFGYLAERLISAWLINNVKKEDIELVTDTSTKRIVGAPFQTRPVAASVTSSPRKPIIIRPMPTVKVPLLKKTAPQHTELGEKLGYFVTSN